MRDYTRGALAITLVALVLLAVPRTLAASAPAEPGVDLFGGVRLLADEPGLLCAGAGLFDVLKEGDSAERTVGHRAAGQLEYRIGRKLFFIGFLAGILADSDGGGFAYGGLFSDFAFGRLRLAPTLGAGGYRQGDSKEHGGTFQFHSGGNLAYQFDGGFRLGVELDHISNADIHRRNAGVEIALLTLMFPLG